MQCRWFSFVVLCWLNLILATETTDGLRMRSKRATRACVIGAGYSGLATARYLREYGMNFTVFEASRYVGGTWRFDPHVGVDDDGLPLFTSMYKYLRTNTPRQTMEFAGFPFPKDTPSFPTGTCFYKYIKEFVKHFGLRDHIQFQSYVTSIKWVKDHWALTYTHTASREEFTEWCDFIVVASGEYSAPSIPNYKGLEKFTGNIIHSHDYKVPVEFKGQRVLLVGAGASGLDLATHLSNVTATLFHSHHISYNQPNFSPTYVKKADIKEFNETGAVFVDDSFEQFDDVIFCTGYSFNLGFLDENVGVEWSPKAVLPLYQHVINILHPSMTFVGLSKKVITRVNDVQGQYVAALAANKFKLPSQEKMGHSWISHYLSNNPTEVNVIGDDMDNYFGNLTEEAGVVRPPLVLKEIRDFNAINRLEDLLNYRDYDFEIVDDYHFKRWYNRKNTEYCPYDD